MQPNQPSQPEKPENDDDASTSEMWKAIKQERKIHNQNRRYFADAQHELASHIAEAAGLKLLRHTDSHYSLGVAGGWRVNIYPGNRRIYHDENRSRGPYLKLPGEWNILDVVEAAISAMEKS